MVWPRRAERTSVGMFALIADLCEAAFCTKVVSSDGVRSAIVSRWRGEEGAVENLANERVKVESLRGGMMWSGAKVQI